MLKNVLFRYFFFAAHRKGGQGVADRGGSEVRDAFVLREGEVGGRLQLGEGRRDQVWPRLDGASVGREGECEAFELHCELHSYNLYLISFARVYTDHRGRVDFEQRTPVIGSNPFHSTARFLDCLNSTLYIDTLL